jgi:hypothetical protein
MSRLAATNFPLSFNRRLRYVSAMKLLNALLVSTSSIILLATASLARENNTLTDAEKAAGWQLLFNGTDFDGWHNVP